MIHELKTLPEYFEAVADGSKTFEVRKNDRLFSVGDFLALNEYGKGGYTGRCLIVRVTYILNDQKYCKNGYLVLGIEGRSITARNNIFSGINLAAAGVQIYCGHPEKGKSCE